MRGYLLIFAVAVILAMLPAITYGEPAMVPIADNSTHAQQASNCGGGGGLTLIEPVVVAHCAYVPRRVVVVTPPPVVVKPAPVYVQTYPIYRPPIIGVPTDSGFFYSERRHGLLGLKGVDIQYHAYYPRK